MKTLILLLTLATGEQGRIQMPAWECRAIQAEMEHAWSIGGHVDRDDGVRVLKADCLTPTLADLIEQGTLGPCDLEDVS